MKTFGKLTTGTVVNYTNHVTADNTNFVILEHYEDRWGKSTKVLNMNTLELDSITQHTEIKNQWSIVKDNTPIDYTRLGSDGLAMMEGGF